MQHCEGFGPALHGEILYNSSDPLPGDDREAVILATESAGPYTAVVRGANNSLGLALVEVYRLP